MSEHTVADFGTVSLSGQDDCPKSSAKAPPRKHTYELLHRGTSNVQMNCHCTSLKTLVPEDEHSIRNQS